MCWCSLFVVRCLVVAACSLYIVVNCLFGGIGCVLLWRLLVCAAGVVANCWLVSFVVCVAAVV